QLENQCTVHVGTSTEIAANWNQPIDLFFIDGDHTYQGVRSDFELFKPWFSDRTLVAFHDSAWELYRNNPWYRDDMGVPQYLQDLRDEGFRYVTFNTFPGITLMHANREGFDFLPFASPNFAATERSLLQS